LWTADRPTEPGNGYKLRSRSTRILCPSAMKSCSLQRSPGPIARGRNVAISAATSGRGGLRGCRCSYDPNWLERLTAPILNGEAEYAVGGSCLDPADRTLWDIASARFSGVKLSPAQKTKSCTARSMAFRKLFGNGSADSPRPYFSGEDTMFDSKVRALVTPAFADHAKAFYRPRHTLHSALRQTASYARTDGVLGVRPVRLLRECGPLPRGGPRRSRLDLLAHPVAGRVVAGNVLCLPPGLALFRAAFHCEHWRHGCCFR